MEEMVDFCHGLMVPLLCFTREAWWEAPPVAGSCALGLVLWHADVFELPSLRHGLPDVECFSVLPVVLRVIFGQKSMGAVATPRSRPQSFGPVAIPVSHIYILIYNVYIYIYVYINIDLDTYIMCCIEYAYLTYKSIVYTCISSYIVQMIYIYITYIHIYIMCRYLLYMYILTCQKRLTLQLFCSHR